MRREIRLHPDPVLRATAAPVEDFGIELRQLAEDMLETMYAAPGRGLAAPQVGALQRIFVMDASWKTGAKIPQVFVNPVITARHGSVVGAEACLSIPGREVRVARAAAVELDWHDLNGSSRSGRFEGFEALCIQHETDHLDGVLCIDRMATE